MEPNILESGSITTDTDKEFKSGSITLNMRENGEMIKQMDEVDCIMLTEMSMTANGKMIKLMAKESILMLTEQFMMVNGLTTNSTDLELNHGQMVQGMRVTTSTGRKREKELFILLMDLSLKVTLREMKSMDLAFMNGLTVRNTKASGSTTKCAEEAT